MTRNKNPKLRAKIKRLSARKSKSTRYTSKRDEALEQAKNALKMKAVEEDGKDDTKSKEI